ncbi:MAG: site-specific DNA-methyltransferase [Phycisphaerales bacterium]|nr:site-specific DNA-methyltransferase [Phycisphaerales bacterium]
MLTVNRIHRGDAIEGLSKLEDESVDLVVTDPPYNIADSNKKTIRNGEVMTTKKAWGSWDSRHPFDHDLLIMKVISECYRVLKPGGALYMFTARQDNGFFVRHALARGFTYRTQLVMIKTPALPSIYKNAWRSAFEVCMFLTKGRLGTFNFLSQQQLVNVFHYTIRHRATSHPTEKPLVFIERLVQVSSNPGDLVLDPFMGSGTTAVACKRFGRRFVGFELNRDYLKMANQRLRQTPDHPESAKEGESEDDGPEGSGST